MDGALWGHVVADLRADHRCVVPTLPFGAHRRPMRDDADLSLRGQAALVHELVERLGLRDVTLVQNDLGYAQLIAVERPDWLARLVLASCEAFDNLPPRPPRKGLPPPAPPPPRRGGARPARPAPPAPSPGSPSRCASAPCAGCRWRSAS